VNNLGLHRTAPPAAIEFRDVCFQYDNGTDALRDVTFRVNRDEFVFVVGHTGSGKSSLLRLLIREYAPSSGEIAVNGRSLSRMAPREIPFLRRTIGVVFQDYRLLPDRTLHENVAFALRVIGVGGKEVQVRTAEALARVGLSHRANVFPAQVSGGELQRAAIARAMVNRPAILLADEPTGSLDPDTSFEIASLLEQINRSGTTVLVATHDRLIVDELRRRVVQLDHGRVVRNEEAGGYSASRASHAPVTAGGGWSRRDDW
jgi:cell division transport system ATP-binding protein